MGDSLWVKLRGLTPHQAQKGELVRRIMTVLTWFVGSIFAAIYIPGIDSVIPILGGCASAFIVIFPGLCLLMVVLNEEEEELKSCRRMTLKPVASETTITSDATTSTSATKSTSASMVSANTAAPVSS